MPSGYSQKLTMLEQLTIIKYIRPDALESYIQGFLAEVKHKSYAVLSKTNLETHARSNWQRRPTMLFYGNDLKNPTEVIELIGARNKRECEKVSLGDVPINLVIELMTRACDRGKWLVLENMHLISDSNLRLLIKKVNSLLEEEYSDNFKIWMTYYIDTDIYQTFMIS
jgi:hypothetical protein